MSVRENIKIMGASALMFRKGEYPTEKDLDIIIDIFTKMKFYSSGIDKEKLSKGECFSISFTNDHWRRRWDDDDYQWDSLDDNDHIIIYFYPNVEIEDGKYIPSMGETVPDFFTLKIFQVEADYYWNSCIDILNCFRKMYLWKGTFIQRMI